METLRPGAMESLRLGAMPPCFNQVRSSGQSFACGTARCVVPQWKRQSCSRRETEKRVGVRCAASNESKVEFFGKLGRVIEEKSKGNVDRLVNGFSQSRENLSVVDEVLTCGNLTDSENTLGELEEKSISGLQSTAWGGHKVTGIFSSVNSSSRLGSKIKPSKVYSEKLETSILEGVEKNEICGMEPVENSAGKRVVHFTRGFFQVLETVAEMVAHTGNAMIDAVRKPNTVEEVQLLTALRGRVVCAAAPLLFAAISQSVNTPLTVVASGMAKWLELYSGVLMVRVLLSWFPNIPWERQPLQAMRDMCDPYLNLFRNIIPPLFNALDLSPMLAFLVLGVLTSILNTTVQSS